MVGSDCSFIFCRSRLTNTAATRLRSSALPVSFSTIEASVTSCSGDLDRNIRIAALPDFRQHALLGLLHALDHLLARGAARKFVGFRQQGAFARYFADGARKDIVVGKPADDLFGGQPFGNRDGMLHHLAFDDGADDVAQAGVLLKRIFAGLEFGARLQREHAADEGPADCCRSRPRAAGYRRCRSFRPAPEC